MSTLCLPDTYCHPSVTQPPEELALLKGNSMLDDAKKLNELKVENDDVLALCYATGGKAHTRTCTSSLPFRPSLPFAWTMPCKQHMSACWHGMAFMLAHTGAVVFADDFNTPAMPAEGAFEEISITAFEADAPQS